MYFRHFLPCVSRQAAVAADSADLSCACAAVFYRIVLHSRDPPRLNDWVAALVRALARHPAAADWLLRRATAAPGTAFSDSGPAGGGGPADRPWLEGALLECPSPASTTAFIDVAVAAAHAAAAAEASADAGVTDPAAAVGPTGGSAVEALVRTSADLLPLLPAAVSAAAAAQYPALWLGLAAGLESACAAGGGSRMMSALFRAGAPAILAHALLGPLSPDLSRARGPAPTAAAAVILASALAILARRAPRGDICSDWLGGQPLAEALIDIVARTYPRAGGADISEPVAAEEETASKEGAGAADGDAADVELCLRPGRAEEPTDTIATATTAESSGCPLLSALCRDSDELLSFAAARLLAHMHADATRPIAVSGGADAASARFLSLQREQALVALVRAAAMGTCASRVGTVLSRVADEEEYVRARETAERSAAAGTAPANAEVVYLKRVARVLVAVNQVPRSLPRVPTLPCRVSTSE